MRFAFLGDDPTVRLLAAAAASAQHELVAVQPFDTAWLGRFPPYERCVADWSELVSPGTADVVVVGRARDGAADRSEQLRRLTQVGVPLLVVHPAVLDADLYYELEMIRRETKGVLLPYVPGWKHPALDALAEQIRGSDPALGTVQHIQFDRRLAVCERHEVLGQFAADLLLLGRIAGPPEKLAALGRADADSAYAHLAVQLWMSGETDVRWSVGPGSETDRGSLLVSGTRGQAELRMAADSAAWQLETRTDTGSSKQVFSSWSDANHAVQEMVLAVRQGAEPARFLLAARSVEVAQSVTVSLNRGRPVEVSFEGVSETTAFKGVMTAAGCGLLGAGLLVMVCIGLADAFGLPWLRSWHIPVLALLLLFLAVQCIAYRVLRGQAGQSAPAEESAAGKSCN